MIKSLVALLFALSSAAAFAALDVNKASLAELEAVKGVGTSTAAKVLDERKKSSFKDWHDVMQRVGGIKEARAGKLSAAGLTVNGEAYAGTAHSAPAKGHAAKEANPDKVAKK